MGRESEAGKVAVRDLELIENLGKTKPKWRESRLSRGRDKANGSSGTEPEKGGLDPWMQLFSSQLCFFVFFVDADTCARTRVCV